MEFTFALLTGGYWLDFLDLEESERYEVALNKPRDTHSDRHTASTPQTDHTACLITGHHTCHLIVSAEA